jgi:hypothetical protein
MNFKVDASFAIVISANDGIATFRFNPNGIERLCGCKTEGLIGRLCSYVGIDCP